MLKGERARLATAAFVPHLAFRIPHFLFMSASLDRRPRPSLVTSSGLSLSDGCRRLVFDEVVGDVIFSSVYILLIWLPGLVTIVRIDIVWI